MDTYSESAEGLRITRARAAQEVRSHGFTSCEDVSEVLAQVEFGTDGLCDAADVLTALGY